MKGSKMVFLIQMLGCVTIVFFMNLFTIGKASASGTSDSQTSKQEVDKSIFEVFDRFANCLEINGAGTGAKWNKKKEGCNIVLLLKDEKTTLNSCKMQLRQKKKHAKEKFEDAFLVGSVQEYERFCEFLDLQIEILNQLNKNKPIDNIYKFKKNKDSYADLKRKVDERREFRRKQKASDPPAKGYIE